MTANFLIGETVRLVGSATTIDDETPVDLATQDIDVKVKAPGEEEFASIPAEDIALSDDGFTMTAVYVPEVAGQHKVRLYLSDANGTTIKKASFHVDEDE